MKADTEAKWMARVAEWRASGKKAEEFAVGRGFHSATLTNWSSRLRRGSEPRQEHNVRLARVIRPAGGAVPVSAPGRGIDIEAGGVRVIVHRGFDGELLREVLAVLRDER